MLRVIIVLLLSFLYTSSSVGQIWLADQTKVIFDLGQTELVESTKDWFPLCDGFKFRMGKGKETENAEIRFRDQPADVKKIFNEWASLLNAHPDRIITLFIEPEIPWEKVRLNLEENGLMNLVVIRNSDGSFPSLNQILADKKQIIIFTLNEENPLTNWVFQYWEYGFQLKPSLNAPTLINDLEKGDYRSDLMMIEANSGSELFKALEKKNGSSGWSGWQFFINYLLNIWQQNGKKAAFVITDQGSGLTRVKTALFNSFKIVHGKVLHNLLPLDYVIWDGAKQKYTNGVFNFPIFPNEKITLTPSSPGFEFSPGSVQIDGTDSPDTVYFYANSLNIKKQLQLYFPFKENTHNYSGEDNDGINHGLAFRSDLQRGQVAEFGHKRWISLPPANELGIVQSDFTFSVWIKPDSLNSEQSIIGTYSRDLRGSIHLSLRNSIPYFGFFGNDHLGIRRFETGKWYHVVWRYMKFSGEQAIYVNGELDSRSINHPAYEGADSLYIGRTTLAGGKYFSGQMSDFILWNRALSESEILLLAKDLSPIKPATSFYYWYWGASLLAVLLASVVVLILSRRKTRSTPVQNLKSIPEITKPAEPITTTTTPLRKVSIQLFGKLALTDLSGMNRVSDLSPKIRELLLVLLLYSEKYVEGISTEELTIVLWNGFDGKKATNNRNVSVHKLRMILKELPGIELHFDNNFWKIKLDSLVEFDYSSCFTYLKKLDDPSNHKPEILSAFYNLISKGKFLPEDQHPWLDTFKERINTEIVDLLNFILEKNKHHFSKEELVTCMDMLMLFDPINEEMIEMLLKNLSDAKLAKHYYNKFSEEYKLHYGEKFTVSFSQLFK